MRRVPLGQIGLSVMAVAALLLKGHGLPWLDGVPEVLVTPLGLLLLPLGAAAAFRTDRLPAPLADPPRGTGPRLLFLVETVGIAFFLRWIVGGIVYWCALPLLAVSHARRVGRPDRSEVLETVLLYLMVLGVGVSGIWGFVGHLFLADRVAESIGWAVGSPFQSELAMFQLGYGMAGLLCLWIRDRFWLAVGLIVSTFLFGAAVVHVRELLLHGNVNPGNIGPAILFGDVVVPAVLMTLLLLRPRWATDRHRRGPDGDRPPQAP